MPQIGKITSDSYSTQKTNPGNDFSEKSEGGRIIRKYRFLMPKCRVFYVGDVGYVGDERCGRCGDVDTKITHGNYESRSELYPHF